MPNRNDGSISSDVKMSKGDLMRLIGDDFEAASLLLVGSINEGLGTPTSDIDILAVFPDKALLTPLASTEKLHLRLAGSSASFPQANAIVANYRTQEQEKLQVTLTSEINIRNLQKEVLKRASFTARRINGDTSAIHREGVVLQYLDQVLMHRIYTGSIITGKALIQSIRAGMDHATLAEHVATLQNTLLHARLSDLEGLWLEDRETLLETKIYLTQKILIALAGYILASVGETNVVEKLFFRLLLRHESRLGNDVVRRLLTYYRDVSSFGIRPAEDIKDFVAECLDIVAPLNASVTAEAARWVMENQYSNIR